MPVSRHTEIYKKDVETHTDLKILLESEVTGICLLRGEDGRHVYMFNHLEYDAETLKNEYMRDVKQGLSTALPYNYFPDDNPDVRPPVVWRAHRTMLFNNWLNMVYQGTPYDLSDLHPVKKTG